MYQESSNVYLFVLSIYGYRAFYPLLFSQPSLNIDTY